MKRSLLKLSVGGVLILPGWLAFAFVLWAYPLGGAITGGGDKSADLRSAGVAQAHFHRAQHGSAGREPAIRVIPPAEPRADHTRRPGASRKALLTPAHFKGPLRNALKQGSMHGKIGKVMLNCLHAVRNYLSFRYCMVGHRNFH
jgi:hypothetical protein